MSVIRLGSPAIPVKITEQGTCLAKLEHVWQAARRFAKRNGYKVVKPMVSWMLPRFEAMSYLRGSRI